MAYEEYHGDTPVVYMDEKKQEWFETLEHVSKFAIPNNLVSMTTLKKFGINVQESDAVAWAYNAHSHEVYLLYDLNYLKPSATSTNRQKEKYKKHLEKLT